LEGAREVSNQTGSRTQFDHEKLDVYRLELKFLAWASVLIDELREGHGAKVREECDHLNRASLSSVFNTAEGNGKRQRRTRAKFFDDARGSSTECAACLDALIAKGFCSAARIADRKAMLLRIVSMLTKLVERFSGPASVREECEAYGAIEDEEEDEDE
jgi:four helix bundle protein